MRRLRGRRRSSPERAQHCRPFLTSQLHGEVEPVDLQTPLHLGGVRTAASPAAQVVRGRGGAGTVDIGAGVEAIPGQEPVQVLGAGQLLGGTAVLAGGSPPSGAVYEGG
ncbi:hypothetical protein AB0G35_24630 [Streptomyces sp. NPDC021749]|uniref:hypothetical protein n=1 Tax=Streptomyces sp. NPDC021749 TaxID=3154905 RepID=UPI0033C528C3